MSLYGLWLFGRVFGVCLAVVGVAFVGSMLWSGAPALAIAVMAAVFGLAAFLILLPFDAPPERPETRVVLDEAPTGAGGASEGAPPQVVEGAERAERADSPPVVAAAAARGEP